MKKRCLIFCAGEFDAPVQAVEETDILIAADGGLTHLQKLGLTPHVALGDFDSLGYVPQNAEVFPVEKDDTDSMLAARQGLAMGCEEFWFYGAMDGPRPDHTLANYQTLSFLASRGAAGYLVGLTHMATVVRKGTLRFPAGSRGILSLFCLGPNARGVTLRGLKYPLEKGTLTHDYPLGVSNHFLEGPASVTVEDGELLVLYSRDVGFPQREEFHA